MYEYILAKLSWTVGNRLLRHLNDVLVYAGEGGGDLLLYVDEDHHHLVQEDVDVVDARILERVVETSLSTIEQFYN